MRAAVAGVLAAAFLLVGAGEVEARKKHRGCKAAPTKQWRVEMDAKQLRELVVDVLKGLEPEIPYSEAAVELLLLTAAQETQLGRWIKQLRGPARGIYQMEPETERHVLAWVRKTHPALADKVAALNCPGDDKLPGGDRDMIFNLAYQTAMARVNYLRFPGEIPTDMADQAIYYKRHWNTPAGKATAIEALLAYRRHVLGVA